MLHYYLLIILTESGAVTPFTIVTTPKSYNTAPAVYKNRSLCAYKSNSENFASKRFSPSPSTPHYPQTENVQQRRFSASRSFYLSSLTFHLTSTLPSHQILLPASGVRNLVNLINYFPPSAGITTNKNGQKHISSVRLFELNYAQRINLQDLLDFVSAASRRFYLNAFSLRPLPLRARSFM